MAFSPENQARLQVCLEKLEGLVQEGLVCSPHYIFLPPPAEDFDGDDILFCFNEAVRRFCRAVKLNPEDKRVKSFFWRVLCIEECIEREMRYTTAWSVPWGDDKPTQRLHYDAFTSLYGQQGLICQHLFAYRILKPCFITTEGTNTVQLTVRPWAESDGKWEETYFGRSKAQAELNFLRGVRGARALRLLHMAWDMCRDNTACCFGKKNVPKSVTGKIKSSSDYILANVDKSFSCAFHLKQLLLLAGSDLPAPENIGYMTL